MGPPGVSPVTPGTNSNLGAAHIAAGLKSPTFAPSFSPGPETCPPPNPRSRRPAALSPRPPLETQPNNTCGAGPRSAGEGSAEQGPARTRTLTPKLGDPELRRSTGSGKTERPFSATRLPHPRERKENARAPNPAPPPSAPNPASSPGPPGLAREPPVHGPHATEP